MPKTAKDFLKERSKPSNTGLITAGEFLNNKRTNTAPKGLISAEDFAKNLPPPEPSYFDKVSAPIKELGATYGIGENAGGDSNIAVKLQKDITEAASDIEKGDVAKGFTKAALRTAGDVAGLIFAPIGTAINTLLAATGVNKGFETVGEISQTKSGFNPIDLITDIPAVQEWAQAHPNAGEDFNRALNIILAKADPSKIEPKRAVNEVVEKVFPDAPKPVKKLILDSTVDQTEIKVNTPRTRQEAYAKEQGYEPITPEKNLPVIDYGTKAADNLPIIEANPPVEPFLPKGAKYEPVTETVAPQATPPRITAQEFAKVRTPAEIETTTQKYEPLNVDTETVAKRIEQENLNLNEFQRQVNKAQVEQISKMDLAHVKDVALGRALPDGSLPANAYLAVLKNAAEKMVEKGDTRLAEELSKSNLNRKAGQELQATQIAGQDNIVDILSDIRTKIEDNISPKLKRQREIEVNKLYNDLSKAFEKIKDKKPTKAKVLKILDNLKCK